MNSRAQKKNTSWEAVADWYDALLTSENTYQTRVILPNLLRLMHIKKGDAIVDIACGQGFFSAAFAASGARVTGVDISPSLLEKAKSSVPTGLFYKSNAEAMPFLKSNFFDAAVCVLGLQNIEKAHTTIAEAARALKPGRSLFIVLNHPAFRIPNHSEWGWDENKKIQYRRIEEYMHESKSVIAMHPSDPHSATTVSFHRPLQYYSKACATAGLSIVRMEEWVSDKVSAPGPRAKAENEARSQFPLFLFLQLEKKPIKKA